MYIRIFKHREREREREREKERDYNKHNDDKLLFI